MTRLWVEGEGVDVESDADGLPLAFIWQGSPHKIVQIEEIWEVQTDWWEEAGEVWRVSYAVITHDNLLCVLYHDRLHDQWRLSKVYD